MVFPMRVDTCTSDPLGQRGRALTYSLLIMCHLLSLWIVCVEGVEVVSGRSLTRALLFTVGIAMAWSHPWIPLYLAAVPALQRRYRRMPVMLLVVTGPSLLVAAIALSCLCLWGLLTVPLVAAVALAYVVPSVWVIVVGLYLRNRHIPNGAAQTRAIRTEPFGHCD